MCGGAQLSWGFLALGSVLSVALLGGWSLFGTFVGLLGFLAFSPWENSSFGLVGLLVILRNLGSSLGQYGTLWVSSLSFLVDLALNLSLVQLGTSALSPTY